MLERAHNLDHQITDVTSPALDLHFRRDPAGNIDRLGTAPGAATPLEEYAYDDLCRLLAVQDDLSIDIEAYAYDLIGNRQSKTTTAGTELYDYAAGSHRLIEVDSNLRGYDAVGNLISDQAGSRTYTYGDHNRLTAFSDTGDNASYQYNGRGERAYKAVQSSGGGTTQSFSITNSTYFFYDEAGRLLAEHSAGMLGPIDTFREYVYLDDVPVALVEPNGDAYHLHADHLGTPRAVTDGNGTKRWEWEFQSNPFGELLPDGDPEKTGKPFILNLRFPGQYYDAESGLHYNYFRDYEPGVGRYVQSDPIGLLGGTNTYSYAMQSPINYFDPDGLEVRFICRPLSGVLGDLTGKKHCFVFITCPEEGWSRILSLFTGKSINGFPITGRKAAATTMSPDLPDDPFDPGNTDDYRLKCTSRKCECEKEVYQRFLGFPSETPYFLLGPNSNSFAEHLINTPCVGSLPEDIWRTLVNSAPGLGIGVPNY